MAGRVLSEVTLKDLYLAEAKSGVFRAKLFLHNVLRLPWMLFRRGQWITQSQIVHTLESSSEFLAGRFRVDPEIVEGVVKYVFQGIKSPGLRPEFLFRSAFHHELLHLGQFLRSEALIASEIAFRRSGRLFLHPLAWPRLRHEIIPGFVGTPGYHLAFLSAAPATGLRLIDAPRLIDDLKTLYF